MSFISPFSAAHLHEPLFVGSEAASQRPALLLSWTDNQFRISSEIQEFYEEDQEDITAERVRVYRFTLNWLKISSHSVSLYFGCSALQKSSYPF